MTGEVPCFEVAFSSRSAFELRPNALSLAVAARRASGRRLLDLTVSNPTTVGLSPPWARVCAALSSGEAGRYEPAAMGLPAARAAVSQYYQTRGFCLDSEHVCLTASTSEGYAFVFKLLCDPGDHVLVPAPSYPLFDYLAALDGVQVDRYPLHECDGWAIDVGALAAAITPRTKAIVVVSPNNPTGSYLKRGEREALRDLCARHALVLVCDEVFADYALREDEEGVRVTSMVDELAAPTFVLSGLSKVAGLPQLKLGWIAIAGPERFAREARERLELIGDTYLSVGTPVMLAAPALLALADEAAQAIRARTTRNLAWIARHVARSPCTLLPVEAGWSAILRVPRLASEESMCVGLLEEAGVLVHPGHFFDLASEAFVVVSLLTEPDVLSEGLGKLLDFMRERA